MNSRRFICPSRAGERYEGSIARPKRAVLTPGTCPGPGSAGKGGSRLMGAVFARHPSLSALVRWSPVRREISPRLVSGPRSGGPVRRRWPHRWNPPSRISIWRNGEHPPSFWPPAREGGWRERMGIEPTYQLVAGTTGLKPGEPTRCPSDPVNLSCAQRLRKR